MMPTCQNCGYKWPWKETFKKMFTLENKMKCSSCDKLQYITKKSRNRLSLLGVCPLIWLVLGSLGVPGRITLSAIIVSGVIVLMGMPFLYELGNEDEALF